MKTCKVENCNEPVELGRCLCKKHQAIRRAELYAKKKANGEKYRTTYDKICLNCGIAFKGWNKSSLFCSRKCHKEHLNKFSSNATNHYEYDSDNYRNNIHKHRNIAEQVLGRKLNTNEVVHHIDGNPKNNSLDNLIVISRAKHAALHSFLRQQGALLEQSNNGNSANCWKTLIAQMTTTWLETTNVKVKKLFEIGQSAAKPLLNEEGSETMHTASQVDDDIVQTTTEYYSG